MGSEGSGNEGVTEGEGHPYFSDPTPGAAPVEEAIPGIINPAEPILKALDHISTAKLSDMWGRKLLNSSGGTKALKNLKKIGNKHGWDTKLQNAVADEGRNDGVSKSKV